MCYHLKLFDTSRHHHLALGEVEKPCILSLVDDTLYEEGEELRLVLGNPKSESQFAASVGALNETLVKIKDTADSKWDEEVGDVWFEAKVIFFGFDLYSSSAVIITEAIL